MTPVPKCPDCGEEGQPTQDNRYHCMTPGCSVMVFDAPEEEDE